MNGRMTPRQIAEALGMDPGQVAAAVGPRPPVVKPDVAAAIALLTREERAIGDAIAAQMREDAAYRHFRAKLLGPHRG